MNNNPTPWVNQRDAALFLGISVNTLKALVKREKIPHKNIPYKWKIRQKHLDKIKRERNQEEYVNG